LGSSHGRWRPGLTSGVRECGLTRCEDRYAIPVQGRGVPLSETRHDVMIELGHVNAALLVQGAERTEYSMGIGARDRGGHVQRERDVRRLVTPVERLQFALPEHFAN
jgi:hypothetical protein